MKINILRNRFARSLLIHIHTHALNYELSSPFFIVEEICFVSSICSPKYMIPFNSVQSFDFFHFSVFFVAFIQVNVWCDLKLKYIHRISRSILGNCQFDRMINISWIIIIFLKKLWCWFLFSCKKEKNKSSILVNTKCWLSSLGLDNNLFQMGCERCVTICHLRFCMYVLSP